MTIYRYKKGYSLIEVLVAISILLIALVGPMTIAAKGIQSSIFVREQTIATSLAQEGIEAFIAARNDAALQAFGAGNLSSASWAWATNGTRSAGVSRCFSTNGCNIEYATTNPLDNSKACSNATGGGCELRFDSSAARARYSFSGDATPYRRAIRVTSTSPATGIEIESTVYWGANLFGGAEQSITLTGAIYNAYE